MYNSLTEQKAFQSVIAIVDVNVRARAFANKHIERNKPCVGGIDAGTHDYVLVPVLFRFKLSQIFG